MAYPSGDSTHYRYFLTLGAPPAGPALVNQGALRIRFCDAVARAAGIGGTAASQPAEEEALALWYRRPQGG